MDFVELLWGLMAILRQILPPSVCFSTVFLLLGEFQLFSSEPIDEFRLVWIPMGLQGASSLHVSR